MKDLSTHFGKTLEQIRLLASRGFDGEPHPQAALDLIEDIATLALAQGWRQGTAYDRAASGMETRQGQDRETGLGAEHDSPTAESGDAQPIPPVINTGESE